MFVIGVDPHKGSHTATALDRDERMVGELRVRADRSQHRRLLAWAEEFSPRTWAVEGATGTGALLAQQLVAAGEIVVDVPPTLSARARLLDSGSTDKTDPHDARAAAVVALRHSRLRVVATEDHVAILRLLAKRHHDLTALRTQAIGRLHTVLCLLTPGGLTKNLSATRAATELRRLRPTGAVALERKRLATELLADVRRCDKELRELRARTVAAVTASGTSLLDVYDVGPIVAAHVIGYTGDVLRFPSTGHYARYNGTAPIEASSGPHKRHRLNPRGNRQLNHALHMIAVTQVRNDTAGRAYYLRRQAEGKSRKEPCGR